MKMKDKLKVYETTLEMILSHRYCKGEYTPKECLISILEDAEKALFPVTTK